MEEISKNVDPILANLKSENEDKPEGSEALTETIDNKSCVVKLSSNCNSSTPEHVLESGNKVVPEVIIKKEIVDDDMMDYRGEESDDSGSSTSDSSSSSSSSEDESGPENDMEAVSDNDSDEDLNGDNPQRKAFVGDKSERQKKARESIRTKGELSVEDLPPIEMLQITVDDSVQLIEVGHISAILGVLVIIQGKAGLPALNLESVLFLEGRKSLGEVFETFGPVACPLYSVRYNSPEDITVCGVNVGDKVFYAPQKEEYTKFVFISQLTSLKGSDASWENNNEPPEKYLDYSDDESERRAKKKGGNNQGDDNEEEDKENSGVKKRGPKWRDRRQRSEQQGHDNEGQQSSRGRGRGSRGRGGRIQSWPPKRSDFTDPSADPQLRPPPPPQILPEGYEIQNRQYGFRMQQPKPFSPSGPFPPTPSGGTDYRVPPPYGDNMRGPTPPPPAYVNYPSHPHQYHAPPSTQHQPPPYSQGMNVPPPPPPQQHNPQQRLPPPPPSNSGPVHQNGPPNNWQYSGPPPPPPPQGSYHHPPGHPPMHGGARPPHTGPVSGGGPPGGPHPPPPPFRGPAPPHPGEYSAQPPPPPGSFNGGAPPWAAHTNRPPLPPQHSFGGPPRFNPRPPHRYGPPY